MLEYYYDEEIDDADDGDADKENEKKIINKKTNEEFSVRKTENTEEGSTAIITERATYKRKR